MNLDPDSREVGEPVVTLEFGESQAKQLSSAMSDLLCWARGFKAALNLSEEQDRVPMGIEEIRELNIKLKKAIGEPF